MLAAARGDERGLTGRSLIGVATDTSSLETLTSVLSAALRVFQASFIVSPLAQT
jgi:hypothetical protein